MIEFSVWSIYGLRVARGVTADPTCHCGLAGAKGNPATGPGCGAQNNSNIRRIPLYHMETPMPAIDPAPALRSLISAIPDDRLREFVLEVLLDCLTAATTPATPAARRRPRGRPRKQRPTGRPRGRPRKAATADTAPKPATRRRRDPARLAAQRERDARIKRERRAMARTTRQATFPTATAATTPRPQPHRPSSHRRKRCGRTPRCCSRKRPGVPSPSSWGPITPWRWTATAPTHCRPASRKRP